MSNHATRYSISELNYLSNVYTLKYIFIITLVATPISGPARVEARGTFTHDGGFSRLQMASVFFESLVFLDQVELEFCRNPRGKLECYVPMRGSAAILSRYIAQTYCSRHLNLLIWREGNAVVSSMLFKGVEFAPSKCRVVDELPKAEKLIRASDS